MTWFAHYLGGPLDGEVSVVDSYSPYAVCSKENCSCLYRLVRWVPGDEAVEPFTALVYVWVALPSVEAERALQAFDEQQAAWAYRHDEGAQTRAQGAAAGNLANASRYVPRH